MRKLWPVVAGVIPVLVAHPREDLPRITTITAETVKAGDMITIAGDYLDEFHTAVVLLSNSRTDLKVQIVEQSGTKIRCKVPREAEAGKYHLAILTAGADRKVLDQPITVVIEP